MMKVRERNYDERIRHADSAAPGGSNIDAVRAAGHDLLDAADGVVDQVMSEDSLSWLGENQQEVGQ